MKNSTITTLIGLLSCLAVALIGLIVWDFQEQRPMDTDTGSLPTQTVYSEASYGQMQSISVETAVPLEKTPAESATKSTETPEPSLLHTSSPIESPGPSKAGIPGKNQKLYDELTALKQQNRDDDSIKILQAIIKNEPADLRAHTLLGDLYYRNDRLSDAISVWEKILEIDPYNEGIKALLAKAQRERKTHQEFTHEVTRHFRIKFEGSENRDLYKTVLDLLEEAYSEVGKTLNFYPDQEIIVFLYTQQQFFDVTRAPAWSGGIFDGKIRIPSRGYEDHIDQLKRVLFHEYVHAVVHQMTEQKIVRTGETADGGVPTWFHEGIAQYLEPGGAPEVVDQRLKKWAKHGVFLELTMLQGSFLGFNNQIAGLAYDESLSAVKFLVDEFGPYSLQRLMAAMARQKTLDEAMREAIFISYEEFQSRWEAHLKS